MSAAEPTDELLAAWLDEQLSAEMMASIEKQLRDSSSLQQRVAAIRQRRDQGGHSVGSVWRRMRLSCPSRSTLGGFLLGTLTDDECRYVEFHLQTVGCSVCLANLDDLQAQQPAAGDDETVRRRRRYFETSAGFLSRPPE